MVVLSLCSTGKTTDCTGCDAMPQREAQAVLPDDWAYDPR